MNTNKRFDIVPVTEANSRLTQDGYTMPYERWTRNYGKDRKMGYILYTKENSHDGHWFRTKLEAKQKAGVLRIKEIHDICWGMLSGGEHDE